MTGGGGGNLQLSQGFEVLTPKSGKAYPVPCDEWSFLKEKLATTSKPPWVLPALSFTFLGAGLATFISILLGAIPGGPNGTGHLAAAWAVVATSGTCGVACLCLAIKQHRLERTQVSEVIRQMELIERRFDVGGA